MKRSGEKTAGARELISVADTLDAVPDLKTALKGLKDPLLKAAGGDLDPMPEEAAVLDAALGVVVVVPAVVSAAAGGGGEHQGKAQQKRDHLFHRVWFPPNLVLVYRVTGQGTPRRRP